MQRISSGISNYTQLKRVKKRRGLYCSEKGEDDDSDTEERDTAIFPESLSPTSIVQEFAANSGSLEQQYQSNMVANSIHTLMGGSIMDLRQMHSLRQRQRTSALEYNSDSDSETELEEKIRALAEEDDVWFKGCGLRLTIDTSIFFTQNSVILVVMIFCIIKLFLSDACDIMTTYVPILSAILSYFLVMFPRIFRERGEKLE